MLKPSLSVDQRAWKYAFSGRNCRHVFIDYCHDVFFSCRRLCIGLAMIYGRSMSFFPGDRGGSFSREPDVRLTRKIHRHGLMVTIRRSFVGVAIIFFGLPTASCPLYYSSERRDFHMISGIFRGSIWNQTIPNYLRGRLASIEMMSYLTGDACSAKMGIVAEFMVLRRRSSRWNFMCRCGPGAAVLLPKFRHTMAAKV